MKKADSLDLSVADDPVFEFFVIKFKFDFPAIGLCKVFCAGFLKQWFDFSNLKDSHCLILFTYEVPN